MSDRPDRITPDNVVQVLPRLKEWDLHQLRQLADRTRLSGCAGVFGRDYAGQGYVEVPSLWLLEILDRLQAAEAAKQASPAAPATRDDIDFLDQSAPVSRPRAGQVPPEAVAGALRAQAFVYLAGLGRNWTYDPAFFAVVEDLAQWFANPTGQFPVFTIEDVRQRIDGNDFHRTVRRSSAPDQSECEQ